MCKVHNVSFRFDEPVKASGIRKLLQIQPRFLFYVFEFADDCVAVHEDGLGGSFHIQIVFEHRQNQFFHLRVF